MDTDADVPTYERADAPTERRVDDLLDRMTVAEKAGQAAGTWAGYLRDGHDLDDVKRAIDDHHLGFAAPFGWGGALATDPEDVAAAVEELQTHARTETRLGIPLLFSVDAVHGNAYVSGATVFPNGLGAAATWDPEGVEDAAAVTAKEVRATGAHQNYGPTVDVGREPRWGRVFETFGESPHLVAELAAAKVRGYRGDGLDDPDGVVATAKHFPAYSEPERGEDASPVDISEYKLRNTFLPPLERALDAGVDSVMPSYNSINGEPSHGSEALLGGLLREDLGFEGHVVSDWNGIRHLHEDHHTARDHADGVRQAREAGVDVASVGHVPHAERVVELVEAGDLDEATLDESVRRVLRLKFELGLFEESPSEAVDAETAAETLGAPAHREQALDAARDSMTLLQNDGVLPLSGDEDVFVGGPNADNMVHQLGGWSVSSDDGLPGATIREGVEDATSGDVSYAQGTTLNETEDIDAAVERAVEADVAVLAVGEGWYLHEFGPSENAGSETGEWPTRSDLGLADAQEELVRRVHETGTPVVGVLVTGRPLAVDWMADSLPALLLAYFPGTEGGTAVAETLFGENDPSGRLPITVPRSEGDLPQHHDYLAHPTPIGDDEHPDSYDPLFEFGHGLSYTDFEYGNVSAAFERGDETVDGGAAAGAVQVTVPVANVGDREGTETVQVYARQRHASRVRPVRELVGFDRVTLAAGERTTVEIEVPVDRLGFYKPREGHVTEPEEYRIEVGDEAVSVTVPDAE
ncbi:MULTISPECIES: glycoside hydrolase family 3 N-terminal domain-containing protein [Halobacterium]|uniref:glycoside hydrolase family 3 N-terminal domain-containing protein n=1 Tax=Halobacterium TaxID=2239 RepID=UPI000ADE78EE|nr:MULTISPECIES: glycoside hydrolase family 3 N-terminal domain-containing protein [Halobacterium]MCG1003195.1 glycoside hydrolase family 3 C-terminal domain-containing protein [Halobacterium noricense]